MAHQWFIEFGNQSQGPLTDSQLKTLADGGQVTPSTRIRLGVNGSWTTASSVKGLFAAASVPPPALDDLGFDDLINTVLSPSSDKPGLAPGPAVPQSERVLRSPRDVPLKAFDDLRKEKKILRNVSIFASVLGCFCIFFGGAAGVVSLLAIDQYPSAALQGGSLSLSLFEVGVTLLIMGVVWRLICGLVDLGLYVAAMLEDIRSETLKK